VVIVVIVVIAVAHAVAVTLTVAVITLVALVRDTKTERPLEEKEGCNPLQGTCGDTIVFFAIGVAVRVRVWIAWVASTTALAVVWTKPPRMTPSQVLGVQTFMWRLFVDRTGEYHVLTVALAPFQGTTLFRTTRSGRYRTAAARCCSRLQGALPPQHTPVHVCGIHTFGWRRLFGGLWEQPVFTVTLAPPKNTALIRTTFRGRHRIEIAGCLSSWRTTPPKHTPVHVCRVHTFGRRLFIWRLWKQPVFTISFAPSEDTALIRTTCGGRHRIRRCTAAPSHDRKWEEDTEGTAL
jgi:hypothetical protein